MVVVVHEGACVPWLRLGGNCETYGSLVSKSTVSSLGNGKIPGHSSLSPVEIMGNYFCRLGWKASECSFSSVQLLSRVRLFATPWTAARQASLSITNSWNFLRLMSIELVMPSNHLILCGPLLLLPLIFPNISGMGLRISVIAHSIASYFKFII